MADETTTDEREVATNTLIYVLGMLLIDEPEMVCEMVDNDATIREMVEEWCKWNNCAPTPAMLARLAECWTEREPSDG